MPGQSQPLDSWAEIYLRLGDFDAAIAKYTEILEIEPDFRGPEWSLAYIYAIKENYPETLNWMDSSRAKAPNAPSKAESYRWKGFYYGWLGNKTLSFDCFDKATKIAEVSEYLSSYNKLVVELLKGWFYLNRGELEASREHFQISFDSKFNLPDRILDFLESLILGLLDLSEGKIDSAESRLAEMESLLSEMRHDAWYVIKEMGKYYTALLRAEIHLFKNAVDQAIAISKKASILMIPSVGRGYDWIFLYNFPFQRDVLARAYRQKGDLDKAIDWYEKHIIIDPKTTDRRLIPPKYHYKLAVLYEEKGRKSKAIEQYEKFLDLYKDADPGIAEVEDARKRLAGLKSE
jgi:tetratricopeptide (TPR) repeat protein